MLSSCRNQLCCCLGNSASATTTHRATSQSLCQCRRQIRHMIKYRYLPFDWGKKVCVCHVVAACLSYLALCPVDSYQYNAPVLLMQRYKGKAAGQAKDSK
jgi:hypothetical protein